MATAIDLEKRYSGGSGNTDPDASLGGAMSTTSIDEQNASGITNITGVSVIACSGNNDGNGTLTWNDAGDTLKWQGAGDSAGATVNVSAGGDFVLYSGTKGLLALNVTFGSLPVGNASDTVVVSTTLNTMWDDIDKTESFTGDTEYRCFYLTNTHGSDSFFGVGVYVDSQPTGADSLEIGLDPAGINGTATTIGDEGTAPAGVTFSVPTSGSPLTVGTLAPAEYYAVWVKRILPALTTTSTTNDRSRIGIVAFT